MIELAEGEPIRWRARTGIAAAVVVLLGEYLLLSWMFDAAGLKRQIAWIAGLGYLAPLIIVIGTAMVLFTRSDHANPGGSIAFEPRSALRALPFLGAHAVLFLVFFRLTGLLFGEGALRGDPRAWFGVWALLSLAVIGTLALGVVPLRQLVSFARRAWVGLLIGLLVGIAAWNAGRAAEFLWKPLGGFTVQIAGHVLSWLFTDSISVPARFLVGTNHFQVRVAPECSGFEGIGLMLVLQSSWLIAFRRELRFPNALLLIPLGVVIAWVGNLFRIVALVAVGSRWSRSLAVGGFHSKSGWVLFCAAALGLMILSRRSHFFNRERTSAEEGVETWHPTAAYLAPLLSGIAVQLVAGLFSIEAGLFYPIQVLAILIPLWVYRESYGAWRLSWSWVVASIGVAAFAIDIAFGPRPAHSEASLLTGVGLLSIGAQLVLAIRLLGTIVVLPLAQELAFRGFLVHRLISADFTEVSPGRFTLPSFLISSVAFGALQGNWIAGTLAGMLYALAQYWRGRLSDAFLAHALTSLLAVVYALAAGAGWPP